MANDLTTTTAIDVDLYSPPSLTTSLAALLEDASLWEDRDADLPALAENDRASAQRALACFDAMPRGTTPERISKLIGSISWMPRQDGGADQAKLMLAVYKSTLDDIDADVLAAAVRHAVKTLTFFPTVAELRKIASELPAPKRLVHAWRLRQLLRAQPAPLLADPVAAEDVTALLAGLGTGEGMPYVRAPAPSAYEPTLRDYLELGLTEEDAQAALDERRALLARQAAALPPPALKDAA